MTPGEYLRKTRTDGGYTLAQVSAAYGCSVPYLSDVERGQRQIPKARTDREALCEAYVADEAELDACMFRASGVIDLSDLSPSERDRVLVFVSDIRVWKV